MGEGRSNTVKRTAGEDKKRRGLVRSKGQAVCAKSGRHKGESGGFWKRGDSRQEKELLSGLKFGSYFS